MNLFFALFLLKIQILYSLFQNKNEKIISIKFVSFKNYAKEVLEIP